MKKAMLSNKHKLLSNNTFIILFGVIFLLQMLVLNLLYPLYADDWFYSLIWNYEDTYTAHKVTSIADVLQSQYTHYFGWGGRVVAHVLAQFFIMLNPLVFDIINALVFIAFLIFIYRLANYQKQANVFLFIAIMFALWIFHPVFPSTAIWLTGSCNYLWCTFIILLFLSPYCKLYINKTSTNQGYIFAILFFFVGVLAGWTNENMSVALLFFLVCLLFLLKKQKGKTPLWTYTGFAGAIIGCALLLLAPGNSKRSLSESGDRVDLPFIEMIQDRLSMLLNTYTSYVLILSLAFVALLIYKYVTDKTAKKDFYVLPILIFATAHLAFFAMIGAPIFPPRATFGINTLLIVAIAMLYANIEFKYTILKIANISILLLAGAYFIYGYSIIYDQLKEMDRIWTKREKIVEECKAKGELDVVFDDLFIPHRKLDVYDLNRSPHTWENRSYAAYYEIHSVVRKSKEDYKLNLYPLDEDGNVID